MPTAVERITNHPAWKTLTTLEGTLAEYLERTALPTEAIDLVTRAESVTAFVIAKLRGVDHGLIPLAPLNEINSSATACNSELRNYLANGNIGHLNNTTAQLDQMLLSTAQILPVTSITDAKALRDTILSIRRAAGQHARYLEDEIRPVTTETKALEAKLQQLTSDVTSTKQQLTTLTTTFQDQFTNAQERRTTEFGNDQRLRESAFTDTEKKRTEEFNELVSHLKEAAATHESTLTSKADQLDGELHAQTAKFTTDLTIQTTATLAQIEVYRQQAAALLGVIGDIGITSGYQKTANEARRLARDFQVFAIVAMMVLVAIAYTAFLPVVRGSFSWESFAGRVFVTLTVGVLAAYCARQGDKYTEVERTNRRLELELQSIGPYLLSLSPEKQEALRYTIADRMFGRDPHVPPTSNSPATLVDLIKDKEAREFVLDAIKAIR